MAELKNIKLYGLDGAPIDSAELSADFRAAEKNGPFWVGETGFYFRDGLKKFYIPIAQIDHVFTRVQEIDTHCCCGGFCMYVYRLVACSKGVELCDVRVEDEKLVDRTQALLQERSPSLRIGYTEEDKARAAALA